MLTKIVLTIVGVLLLAGCDDGENDRFDAREPAALIDWVKAHHWSDQPITFANGVLSAQLTSLGGFGDVYGAGSDVRDLIKGYKKAASSQSALKAIRITYVDGFKDKYGNDLGTKPVMTIRFDVLEALKYNFDNRTIYPSDMLDAATIEYLHPGERAGVQKYCADEPKLALCRQY